jgi:hypothetical protein
LDGSIKSPDDLSELQLERLAQVSSLHCRGLRASEIAAKLKMSWEDVQSLIAVARVYQLAKAKTACDEIVAADLRKLEEIEREAWIQWDRSTKRYQELTKESTERDGDNGAEMTIKNKRVTKARLAVAKYLELVLKAIEKKHELLGIGKGKADDFQDIALVEVVIEDRSQLPEVMDYGKFIEMKNSTVDGKVVYEHKAE